MGKQSLFVLTSKTRKYTLWEERRILLLNLALHDVITSLEQVSAKSKHSQNYALFPPKLDLYRKPEYGVWGSIVVKALCY